MEMNEEMMKEAYNKEIEIKRFTKVNESLKAKIDIQQAKQTPEQNQRDKTNKEDTGIYADSDQLLRMIEKNLSCELSSIQTYFKQLIDEKFNNIPGVNTVANIGECEHNDTSKSNHIRSYASAAAKVNDTSDKNFRTILLAAKNEELAEDTDRKKRAKNIIMHGKQELSPNDDTEFINNMIKDL